MNAQIAAVAVAEAAPRITLADGQFVAADIIIVRIGGQSSDELALACGQAVDDGIIVDRWTHTTLADIHAARATAGRAGAYHEDRWMWTNQHELNVQFTGHSATVDGIVHRQSHDAHFRVHNRGDGAVADVTSINQLRETRDVARLVARIDAAQQADPGITLRAFGRAEADHGMVA